MKKYSYNTSCWTLLSVILSLSIFVLIGAYNIDKPGLYYDEALFVNAATGGSSDLFVFKRWGELPVMLMPYIGALKAWLYYPIFKLFDITYLSIRLPTILLGALGLGLTWKYVSLSFGSIASIFFLMMAAVEPSSIFHSRLDWGPTAVMMVFRGGLLLSLSYWFSTGKRKYLLLALSCTGLGTFDKLNFIWVAISAFAAGVLIYPCRFRNLLFSKHKNYLIAIFIISAILVAIFVKVVRIKIFEEIGIDDLGARMSSFLHLLALTIRGEGVYQFVIQGDNPIFNLHAYFLIGTSIIALWGFYRGICDGTLPVRPLVYLALLTSFLAIQILFTKKATGPHHFATFAPLWLIFISVGMASAMLGIQKRSVVLARGIIGFLMVLIVSTSIKIDSLYHDGFKASTGNPHWDPASSTELNIALMSRDVKSIVAVDWGFATNVQALSNNQIKVIDLWPMFNDGLDQSQSKWIRSEFLEKGAVFILHAEGKEVFPAARRHFMDAANKDGWDLQRIVTIHSINGLPFIELFRCF